MTAPPQHFSQADDDLGLQGSTDQTGTITGCPAFTGCEGKLSRPYSSSPTMSAWGWGGRSAEKGLALILVWLCDLLPTTLS